MATIKCPKCQNEMSKSATKCPSCGALNVNSPLILVVLIFMILLCIGLVFVSVSMW